MQWAPNPYALAQLLGDQLDFESLYTQAGRTVDDILRDVFLSGGKHKTMADALAVFQRVADSNQGPITLAEALRSPYVTTAAGEYSEYPEDKFRRVLPVLLEISDETFEGHLSAHAGELVDDKVDCHDPVQGALGDCFLISAMIALAWSRPLLLQGRLTASGFRAREQKSFAWHFHATSPRETEQQQRTVSSLIPLAGKLPRYARSSSRAEYWPALIEKAYVAKELATDLIDREPTPTEYQSITRKTGMNPALACQSLVGGKVELRILQYTDVGEMLQTPDLLGTPSGVMSKPVMAWTKPSISVPRDLWEVTGLWPDHAYALLGTMDDHVVLRNPHGFSTQQHPGYASGPWETGGQRVTLNEKGVFAIARELFRAHFECVGWVDLGD